SFVIADILIHFVYRNLCKVRFAISKTLEIFSGFLFHRCLIFKVLNRFRRFSAESVVIISLQIANVKKKIKIF
ncbi:MAG: hypothetical protein IIU80_07575, partial [Clostridia bacterium]|nr:hypothetical protein [Clostridia bacterium]